MALNYILVQHTGYTQTQHAEFAHAVELRSVTQAVAKKVEAAGGLVFTSYTEAVDAEERENYQPDNQGLVPRAPGVFVHVAGIGEPVYIPAKVSA